MPVTVGRRRNSEIGFVLQLAREVRRIGFRRRVGRVGRISLLECGGGEDGFEVIEVVEFALVETTAGLIGEVFAMA